MSEIEQITQLVTKERQYRVRNENEALAGVYWPDAEVETSWQKGKLNSFVGHTTSEMGQNGLPIVTRVCGPVVHQRSATRAYVESPTISDYWEQLAGTEVVLTEYMRLLYRVEKRDGEWKIHAMQSLYESDTLAPAVPGTPLSLDTALLQTLRHPYRFLAYTRLKNGGQIGQDLLGVDQPAAVAAAYAALEAWAQAGAEDD